MRRGVTGVIRLPRIAIGIFDIKKTSFFNRHSQLAGFNGRHGVDESSLGTIRTAVPPVAVMLAFSLSMMDPGRYFLVTTYQRTWLI